MVLPHAVCRRFITREVRIVPHLKMGLCEKEVGTDGPEV